MTPFRLDSTQNIFRAPNDPSQWPAFRAQLAARRDEIRSRVNYDDSLYRRPEFAWSASASAYVCYFLMMYDEAFYDAATGRYTVDALLDSADADFGGCDSVVLWHAYPRIGVDERNQFDFYRDMPGGLAGVRTAVDAFHARGVRVYINYNPWDRATRREAKPDVDMLAEFVGVLDIDGIFLDTMAKGGGEFRATLDAVRPGVVLEGENSPSAENICDHHASWAQWFDDSEAPGVLRHKWMERRHMQHQTQRWNGDHTAELHRARMNGTGMMLWENVFGAWVPWNVRDRSLLRAMTPIRGRFKNLFSGECWTPLVPTQAADVYASLWSDGGARLWTLVNRSDRAIDGRLLAIDARPGDRHFDLIAGREIRADEPTSIVARGLGCIVATPRVDADFDAFLARQAATQARFDGDTSRPYRAVRTTTPAPTRRYAAAPDGMIAATFNHWTKTLATQVRERECGYYDPNVSDGDGFRDSYSFRTREFVRPFHHHPFAFDEMPVTNAQFADFLHASGYRQRDETNFLRHWRDRRPPADKLDHPVVWVDLDDARAYAEWAGKRLPTEDEWQYAAQNGDGREYPWGGGMHADVCNLRETRDTTAVRAFPAGRNAWGGYDFCGNVWQLTESEATDCRTRFCMIRGGSYLCPTGSSWYVDGAPRAASFSTKFLLMSPSLDHCATIGFRCVVDLEG